MYVTTQVFQQSSFHRKPRAPLYVRSALCPNPIGAPKQTRSLRQRSGKKTGGQPGHEGKTHLYCEDVDNHIICATPAICSECGEMVDDSSLLILERYQVIDISAVIVPHVTEYALQGCTCKCGCHIKGQYPKVAIAPVSYGYGVQATVPTSMPIRAPPSSGLQN